MAAIEHHRDSQPLRDHVLKELGQLHVPKVASRGVANVDRDESLVDATFPFDRGEQCWRSTSVARVMDINVIARVGLQRQMLERRDDVLVRRPLLRRLGRRAGPRIGRGQLDQSVFHQEKPFAKVFFNELNVADAPSQDRIASFRQSIGQVAVRGDEQGIERGLVMLFRDHGCSSSWFYSSS